MRFFLTVLITLATENASMIMPSTIGIHSGAVTHHHDHAITLVSFRTRNTMKSSPTKLTPPEVDLSMLIDIGFLVSRAAGQDRL